VNVIGSPLIIPENQVGLNYYTNPPTMAFPTVVDNSPQLTKSFKIKNTGIADVIIDWKMFDERDQAHKKEDQDLFKISIDKNTGFDSEENPFRLKFDLIEPEPSHGSAFQIEPQHVIIPARETQFFEVKFDSDQGVDTFRSVILSHPQLVDNFDLPKEEKELEHSMDERSPSKHVDLYDYQSDSSDEEGHHYMDSMQADEPRQPSDKERSRKRSPSDNEDDYLARDASKRDLGIVALKLFASTIEPVLTVDMKKKLDGEYYFNFYQWPVDHEEEPSPIQKICLVNETKANLIFNVNTEGPFKIVNTKTNSGSIHPLAPVRPSSKGIKAAPETMFSLQPDKIVQMKIEFSPPNCANLADWPIVKT
jgi:hypothetical protein